VPVRLQHDHLLGIAKDGNIGVMCHEYQLPSAFDFLHRVDDALVDIAVVEIVLWLINEQWVRAVEEQDRQNRRAFLAGGKTSGVFVDAIVAQLNLGKVVQIYDFQLHELIGAGKFRNYLPRLICIDVAFPGQKHGIIPANQITKFLRGDRAA